MAKIINYIGNAKNAIIAGDLNCRIYKPDHKSRTIMAQIEEERYKLVNKKTLVTYVAHNGSSAIDSVFLKHSMDYGPLISHH